MVRVDLLRGRIAEMGTSQRKVAMNLGITEKTFYQKMKRAKEESGLGSFSIEEVAGMVNMLGIDDPRPIFFAPEQ